MATNDPFAPPKSLTDAANQVAQSAQFDAVTQDFDESKGVAGRVGSITSAGGPLMTAARTRAKQASAKMGLQNSSLAAQAGEQSVIETAAPIASADAQLYQSQQLANQTARNNAAAANAQMRFNAGMSGLQLGEGARQFDATFGLNQQNLMEQRRQFDSTLGLEGQKLAQQERQFQGTIGLEGQKLSQQNQQFLQNLSLERDNLAAQREQFAQSLGMDMEQLKLNRDQLSQQDRQFLSDLDQKDRQLQAQQSQFQQQIGLEGQKLSQQESQFARSEANKVTLANIDVQSRKDLMALESTYKKDIESNKNISGAWATMMENINQINNNPDLENSAKQTLIANQQAGFQSFTNFWKKINGGAIDVSDLLNFQQAAQPFTPPPVGPWTQNRNPNNPYITENDSGA